MRTVLIGIVLLCAVTAAATLAADPLLLRPQPQVMQPSAGPFRITAETKIVVPKDWPAYVKVSAQELSKAIEDASGIAPEVVEPEKFAFTKGDIMVGMWEWFNGYVQWVDAAPLGINRPAPAEGYNIRTVPEFSALLGNSERGCFMALRP